MYTVWVIVGGLYSVCMRAVVEHYKILQKYVRYV